MKLLHKQYDRNIEIVMYCMDIQIRHGVKHWRSIWVIESKVGEK